MRKKIDCITEIIYELIIYYTIHEEGRGRTAD